MRSINPFLLISLSLLLGCAKPGENTGAIDPAYSRFIQITGNNYANDTYREISSNFSEIIKHPDGSIDYCFYAYYDRYDKKPNIEADIYACRKGNDGTVIIKDLAGYGKVELLFSSMDKTGCKVSFPSIFNHLEGELHIFFNNKPRIALSLLGHLLDGRDVYLEYYYIETNS